MTALSRVIRRRYIAQCWCCSVREIMWSNSVQDSRRVILPGMKGLEWHHPQCGGGGLGFGYGCRLLKAGFWVQFRFPPPLLKPQLFSVGAFSRPIAAVPAR